MNFVITDFPEEYVCQFTKHFEKTFTEYLAKYYAGQCRGYKDE